MGAKHSQPASPSESSSNIPKKASRLDLVKPSHFLSHSKKGKGTAGTASTQPEENTKGESPATTERPKSDYATPIYETKGLTTGSTPQPPALPPRSQSAMPVTVPCQYRTGKTLGSGTYAIVKEAVHIQTGKYYACKVINKRLMEGREHMVRNEIAVLKRVSSGHVNIVTLHDYFETAHNLYLCFDLCTGGELFDRICAKGNYYEADAAALVRTILKAVKYIHDSGIVHRDLKPENLLFRTIAEDSDIMIADFGLSRMMEEEKLTALTEVCGTPGYMAPEIFLRTGHSKPVDVWAMGVITYFLLAGYTPFDRDTQQQETQAITAGDYKFEPEEYWRNVSETAKNFVRTCLILDPTKRPTAAEALQHKWLADEQPHFVPDPSRDDGAPTDLLPSVKKAFNAKKLWRKATSTIKAINRMTILVQGDGAIQMREKLTQYKEESEKENLEHVDITYHSQKPGDDHSSNDLASKMAKATLHVSPTSTTGQESKSA